MRAPRVNVYRVSALWMGKQVSMEFPAFGAGSASLKMKKYYRGCDVDAVEFVKEVIPQRRK